MTKVTKTNMMKDIDQSPSKVKVVSVLGGDITNKSFDELEEAFDAVNTPLMVKLYSVELSKTQVSFLFENFLQKVEYTGKQSFDVYAINETLANIGESRKITAKKEIIVALFNYLLNYKMVGTNQLILFKNLIVAFSDTILKINEDNKTQQLAGFELEAARLGITVEKHSKQISTMDAQ